MKKQIEIFTTKAHRFGKSILIAGVKVDIDSKGHAMVSEDIVSQALLVGFELVDKNVTFETEEQKEQIQKINEILDSAREEAKAIIDSAKKEAEKIIADAKAEAGIIEENSKKDIKANKLEELQKMKVDELKALCQDAKIPEDQWKALKKDELIKFLMDFIFSEPEDAKGAE